MDILGFWREIVKRNQTRLFIGLLKHLTGHGHRFRPANGPERLAIILLQRKAR